MDSAGYKNDEDRAPLSERALGARGTGYLEGLNPEQREAVETLDGPVLMLAGAGTGKTRALTTRVAHLINMRKAYPSEMLVVTFTNKAATELKTRVGQHLGDVVEGMPWLGTFHSLGAKMLRRHAELVELKPNFTILDTDDQVRLLKQILQAEDIDEKRWPARLLLHIIETWKNKGLGPEKVEEKTHEDAFAGKTASLYSMYQDRLRTLNAVDFGDLLLHPVNILSKHPEIAAKYQDRLRHILVDEYQDTNVAQYLWLRLLVSSESNICCVGDDDQSIYGWRGAQVGNILRFERDFPGAKVIRLERNYRSTPHILAAASGMISANKERLGKTLWTDVKDGEKVKLIGHWDSVEEASWVGDQIEAFQGGTKGMEPYPLSSMAILVRASSQMRAFEERFLNIGIPYRVIGGPRFYERMEIRDAMAYFRIVVSPSDDLAFERIMNTPKRGLGNAASQKISLRARKEGVSMLEAARMICDAGEIGGKGGHNLRFLLDSIRMWSDLQRAGETPHVDLAKMILEESGYIDKWVREKTPEAEGRLENLKELVASLREFDSLPGFLEHVSLVFDNESSDNDDKVFLMTLHGAKGLEFPIVFLPGWEDGLFPSQRSMDDQGRAGMEEERRLGYVGITRAMEHCLISFVSNRQIYGQWKSVLPSRFIDDLPDSHVEILNPPGLYGGSQSSFRRGTGIQERAFKADVYNSPGWRRLQSRRSEVQSDATSFSNAGGRSKAGAGPGFSAGARVFHEKFGYGSVLSVDGNKVSVSFEKGSERHVLAGYLALASDV